MSNIVFSHEAIMNVLLDHHRLPITNDTDRSNYLIIDTDTPSMPYHRGISDTLRQYNIVDFPTIDSTLFTPSTSPQEHSENFEPQISDLDNVEEDSQIASLVGVRNYMLDCIEQWNEESNHTIFHEGLKYLGQVIKDTHVTSLNLRWNGIECDLLINIAQNLHETKIKSLDISGNKIGQKGMTYLESVLGDTQISSFQASDNTVEFDHVNAICQCKGSTKLTTLELSRLSSSKRVIRHRLKCVAPILKDSPITAVNLCSSSINSKQLRLFVQSLVGTNVTSLDLSFNTLGFESISCLARTLKETQINSISLEYNQLGSKTLQKFLRCLVDTKITSLDLIGNNVSYDAMNCLVEALKNSQITSISLSIGIDFIDCNVFKIFASCLKDTKINKLRLMGGGFLYRMSSDSINCLSQVLKYTQITTICLEEGNIDSECLQIFLSCLKDTKVTSLTLSVAQFDYIVTSLAETLKDTQITSILLCRTEMSYESLQIFASCLVDTKITSLGLYGNKLGYDGMKCLAQFLKNTQITTLDLGKNYDFQNTNVESFQAFALCLADTKITSLNLSGNDLGSGTPAGISYLVPVLSNTQITNLNISNNFIGCNSLKNLILHLPDTKITALDISKNDICCNAFYLASILKNTHITTLNLSNNTFVQYNPKSIIEYFKNIAASPFNRWIEKICNLSLYYFAVRKPKTKPLMISYSTLDYDSMKLITQGLLGSEIVKLDLSGNSIDSNGFRCLARAIRNTQTTSLNLSKNRISCSDVKYLFVCLEGSQVKSLNLSYNSIGDKGIEHIANSLDRNRIVELDLSGNNIERKSAYQLCESVKSCKRKILAIIGLKDEVFPDNVNLVVYQGFLIEINKPIIEFGVADSLKNSYKNKAIRKIIYRYDNGCGGYNYLSRAFDNISISEVELSCLDENIATAFKKSNIALLKLARDFCDVDAFNCLSQINFIALCLQEIRYEFSSTCTAIKSAIGHNNIMYLDLSNLNLGEFEFKKLVSDLKNSEIISLNISNNKLGENDVKLLAEVLPNTKITYIDLHGNNIGYEGFNSLKNVVEKTDICWISLGDNNIEKNFPEGVDLSPYIVPRKNTPIAFQMRYLFVQLVSLNNEEFEFITPRKQTELDIKDYPRLVKNVLEIPNSKIHIYDIIYMMNKRHDIELLNKIDRFVDEIRERFSTFIKMYKWTELEQSFGYASFVDLVKECEASKMDDLVECLLLHRVLFYVDDEQNILHPYIYKMLHKYGMPLFNEDLEPHKKEQIVDFYKKHPEIDGVPEIIDLLSSESKLNLS